MDSFSIHCQILRGKKGMNISFFLMLLQDAGGAGVGFLLGSLSVCWALTSENCYKGLPKTSNGEVVTFRGM